MRLARTVRRRAARWAVHSGLFALRQRFTGRRHLVLTFHRVRPSSQPLDAFDTCPSLSVDVFREILEYVCRRFHIVPLRELTEMRHRNSPMAAITFDDGWRDTYDLAFPILRELELSATVFVTTGKIGSSQPFWQQALGPLFRWAAEDCACHTAAGLRQLLDVTTDTPLTPHLYREAVDRWKRLPTCACEELVARVCPPPPVLSDAPRCFLSEAEIRQMACCGIDFGSHTVHHEVLTRCKRRDIDSELGESKSHLESILKTEVDMIAYPNGDYCEDVLRTARVLGYRIGCTTRNARVGPQDDPFLLPRIEPEWDSLESNVVFDEVMLRWRAR